jgi:phage-related protein
VENATIAAFKGMFDQLVAAATAGWNNVMGAAVDAINAGIERIKALWQGLVDTIMGYVTRIQNAMPSMPSWLGGSGQRQSAPVPFSDGGASPMLRAAGVSYQSPYSSLAGRAAPFSVNDNFGSGFNAQMDRVLFRWDEYKRSVNEAAAVTQRAGTTISRAMTTATSGTDGLTRSASAANDNLATMETTAQQMDSIFSSWAQSATMGFVDAMMAGEDLRDTLADLLKDLARLALQKWVLAPIFGTSGGLFAASAPAGLNADAASGTFGLTRAPSAAAVSGLANTAGREQQRRRHPRRHGDGTGGGEHRGRQKARRADRESGTGDPHPRIEIRRHSQEGGVMAFDGTDRDWCAALPAEATTSRRLRVAQFGDGYAQRILDGINNIQRTFTLRYEEKTDAVINAMTAYLEAQRGNAFPFKDQATGVTYQVWCDEWSVEWQRARFAASGQRSELRGSLSVEFVLAYGVTA